MKRLDPTGFSGRYLVAPLTEAELPAVLQLCRTNPFYYEKIGEVPSREGLLEELRLLPPGCSPGQKHFLGYYDGAGLMAILDLVDGYPTPDTAYLGLFMVDGARSGKGLGTALIGELCEALRQAGFHSVRLAYGKNNSQAARFWIKNGFTPLREVSHRFGTMLVAERRLTEDACPSGSGLPAESLFSKENIITEKETSE